MTRSWWDNEDILRQFRDWLTQTEEEIESLDDSREHLEFAERGDGDEYSVHQTDTRNVPALDLPEVGLLQLVEAFTAMRHELKLQTKGTRNLEASVEQSLAGLNAASRDFHSIQANETEAAERATLPLVETLIGLDEGLLRAAQAFQATHRQVMRSTPMRLRENLDKRFATLPWWHRLVTRRWHTQLREAACEALARSNGEEFASLIEGFQLIQMRLTQTLHEHAIRRLDEAGGLVDPNRMTVVELVDDDCLPPETVVEVVRPGYSWGEQVIRFAEVRAVARRTPQCNYNPGEWQETETCESEQEDYTKELEQTTESDET